MIGRGNKTKRRKRQSFEKARGMEKRQAGSKYTGFS
jgi:hypothetical protein